MSAPLPSGLLHVWIRPEYIILVIGLLCSVIGKWFTLHHDGSVFGFLDILIVCLPDVLFFLFVFGTIFIFYSFRQNHMMARTATLFCTVFTLWSVFNFCWLFKNKVQLPPRVLLILFQDFGNFWPILQGHLTLHYEYTIVLAIIILSSLALFSWFFIRPPKLTRRRTFYIKKAAGFYVFVVLLALVRPTISSHHQMGFTGEVLGFSSHWYALSSLWKNAHINGRHNDSYRSFAMAGERPLSLLNKVQELPNIVIIFLESVSHSVAAIQDGQSETMPYLARLAEEGVEFTRTRVPVSHTTKAFWAALTGSYPAIESGHVEAVPQKQPYESLATILAPLGYHSAFFEISKGSFECAPGFFHNLGFDWAYFRDNLEDPCAHLGIMNGDDFRLIDPAMEWVGQSKAPFLLGVITTVTHDPFILPAWYELPKESANDRYLQAVRYNDRFIEALHDRLKKAGYGENTILCIMGDHGTSFRVDKGDGRWVPYEEVVRVPWVIHWPGHIQSGLRLNWPCFQTDVTPTLLSLIGFDLSEAGFEGRNAFEPIEEDRKVYFSSWYFDSPLGYVQGRKKYVYWPYLNKVFLYDLEADPSEKEPVVLTDEQAEAIKADILLWQQKSDVFIDAKRHYEIKCYDHWRVFSIGRSAWAYYIP